MTLKEIIDIGIKAIVIKLHVYIVNFTLCSCMHNVATYMYITKGITG